MRLSVEVPYETLGVDQMIILPWPVILHRGDFDEVKVFAADHRYIFGWGRSIPRNALARLAAGWIQR